MLILLICVFGTLTISFICSLMEAALLSLTPSQLADISARHPRIGAIWRDFKGHIERPIAAILILNTSAHTIGATVAGSQFDELYGSQWIWAFSLIFTFLMLQYTEILPKTLGVHFNQQLALLMARPLDWLIRAMAPLISALHALNRPFERRQEPAQPVSVNDLMAMAAMARHAQQITPHQEHIIRGATKLSSMRVEQVMIPLAQVAVIASDQTLTEAMLTAHLDAHTRYPVCQAQDRGKIIGYVNFKEIIASLRTNPNDPSLLGVMRPVHVIDAQRAASELLREFIEQHIHMAIVKDSAGRHLGLVTLEDLVEVLVGDLEDEFDRLPQHLHELSGGQWLFGGGIEAGQVAKCFGWRAEDFSGPLAPWLEKQLEAPFKAGQLKVIAGVEFTVRRLRRGRIFEVAARKRPSAVAQRASA
jgi:putative hemolysin